MKHNKAIGVAMAVAVVVGLSACSSNDTVESATPQQQQPITTPDRNGCVVMATGEGHMSMSCPPGPSMVREPAGCIAPGDPAPASGATVPVCRHLVTSTHVFDWPWGNPTAWSDDPGLKFRDCIWRKDLEVNLCRTVFRPQETR